MEVVQLRQYLVVKHTDSLFYRRKVGKFVGPKVKWTNQEEEKDLTELVDATTLAKVTEDILMEIAEFVDNKKKAKTEL